MAKYEGPQRSKLINPEGYSVDYGIRSYCETCGTEIVNEDSLKDHQENRCTIIHTWKYGAEYNGKQLSKMLHDVINSQSGKTIAKGFVKQMMNEHRALQMEVVVCLRYIIEEYSKLEDIHFDGRNEHGKRLCREMMGVK